MPEHALKVWPEFFGSLENFAKPFEVRRDDRGFKVDDILVLREWSEADGYSGRELRRRVTYTLRGGQFGIERGFVVLGLCDVD